MTQSNGNGNRNDTQTRLARVEEGFDQVRGDVGKLTAAITGLTQKVDSALSQNETPRITMASAFQFLGLLGTWSVICGGLVWTYMEGHSRAIEVELTHLKQRIDTHQADGHPHTVIGQIGAVKEQFAEVETQNRALKETMLLRDEIATYKAILQRNSHDAGTDEADIPQYRRRDGSHPPLPPAVGPQPHNH